MDPVLGQWAVITSPVSRVISARNRLYRRIRVPLRRGVGNSIIINAIDKHMISDKREYLMTQDFSPSVTTQDENDPSPTAGILIIGNEILSGRTADKNINFLALELNKLHIPVREVRVVRDEIQAIVSAVRALSQTYTYVFTTGGIGPTHDDITWEAMGVAFNRPIIEHPEALKRLQLHYGDALTDARRSMAHMPEGSELIDNAVSAAPGFRIQNVHVMAGIPSILQVMFKSLEHTLVGGPVVHTESVAFHRAESLLAPMLTSLQNEYPEVEIGSYPSFKNGAPSVTIVARSKDEKALGAVVNALQKEQKARG